jgi:hypothetical protein
MPRLIHTPVNKRISTNAFAVTFSHVAPVSSSRNKDIAGRLKSRPVDSGFAAAAIAEQVKTDYDRSADFSQFKTFSWEKVQTQPHCGWIGSKQP